MLVFVELFNSPTSCESNVNIGFIVHGGILHTLNLLLNIIEKNKRVIIRKKTIKIMFYSLCMTYFVENLRNDFNKFHIQHGTDLIKV